MFNINNPKHNLFFLPTHVSLILISFETIAILQIFALKPGWERVGDGGNQNR
jgi:hypothetical protein